MSWGISPNAEEKEKIFADFADCLNGMNCAGGLSYSHYSEIFDYGRKLADEEYQQGRADGIREFAEWLSNTEYVANHDSFILPLRGYFTIDEIVKEFDEKNSN